LKKEIIDLQEKLEEGKKVEQGMRKQYQVKEEKY